MADRSEQLAGKAKEAAGKVTGDQELESEGRVQDRTEQTKQKLQEAKDKATGALRGIKQKFDEERRARRER